MSYCKAKMHQIRLGWGSSPDPAEELTAFHQTPYLDLRGLLLTAAEGRKVGEKGKEGNGREKGRDSDSLATYGAIEMCFD